MNNILTWFYPYNNKLSDNTDTSNFNKMEFIIDSSGVPHIKVTIVNTDDKSALAYADLMHSVGIGLYNNSMIDILTGMSVDNDIKNFITKVLMNYSLYQTDFVLSTKTSKYSKTSQPVIKPSEFTKKSL